MIEKTITMNNNNIIEKIILLVQSDGSNHTAMMNDNDMIS